MAGDAPFLMELALFKDFSASELEQMSAALEEVDHEPGHLLFKEGAWAASMYLVVSGAIEIFKPLPDGKEVIFTTLTSGACLGEMALVRDMYRTGSARAKVRTRLLVLKKERLAKLESSSPAVAARLYRNISAILADRIDQLNRDLQRARETQQSAESKGLFGKLFG